MYQLSCLMFHITYTNKVWKPINYDLITSNMDRIMKLNLWLLDYNYMYIHNNLHNQLNYDFLYSLQLY